MINFVTLYIVYIPCCFLCDGVTHHQYQRDTNGCNDRSSEAWSTVSCLLLRLLNAGPTLTVVLNRIHK